MHVHMNILDKINLADIAHNSVDRNVSRKHFDIFLRIIGAIRAAEIVESVRKYMDGISQNLQSLSSY